MGTPQFDAVVFAGGGSRCIWQIGFWQVVAPEIDLKPKQIAAVSAGSAMASCLLAGRVDEAIEAFSRRMEANAKNFYPGHLLVPGKKAFPQSAIYRESMLEAIDEEALGRLRDGPPLRILLGRPPRWLGARSGALMGFLCYRLEKKLRHPVHPQWGKKIGFQPWVLEAQSCQSPEELVDLILQSSCTPPFTPLYRRDKKTVLDGGVVDNVPVDALDGEPDIPSTLVLLTRPYPPEVDLSHPRRTYVQPSQKAPVSTWDYTSPEGLQATYAIGKRDGEAYLESLARS